MENMCSVLMNLNSFYFLTIYITAQMRTLFNYKTTFSRQLCTISEGCSIEAGANNKIIILPHFSQIKLIDNHHSSKGKICC